MRRLLKKTLIASVILITFTLNAFSQLYEWRGPERSGIYNETGLLKEWPESGPELIWELDNLGDGYSSPTVTGNTLYITGRKEQADVLSAFSLDGKKKREIVYGDAWIRNHTGTRCIPTYSNGNIFLISGGGDIVCVDSNGKIKWSKNHVIKAVINHVIIMPGVSSC